MFGSKLRSWMEAVRPRKKQHRKDKQNKKSENSSHNDDPKKKGGSFATVTKFTKKIESELSSNGPLKPQPSTSRYSVANLSSPESAYSTGYSTDGTSPGAPPEYYTEVKSSKIEVKQPFKPQCDNNPSIHQETQKVSSPLPEKNRTILPTPSVNHPVEVSSPRQRNRIRTNPWLTTCTNNTPTRWQNSHTQDLPDPRFFTSSSQCVASASPRVRRKSLPSSSCSSLSGDAETYWENSEDDCTLNEMMGKYDESYVYEKETDILSDSEPNDLDTDIDTGQDGGDELELQEGDLYFIDDGSYTETNQATPSGENKNTGHCSYFNFQEKRKASRRKTTRKSRHKSSRKRTPPPTQIQIQIPEQNHFKLDGSRSVGATPLFARRTRHLPISKLAIEEKLTKRSNSTHLYQSNLNTIDKKDEEAEQKYEELIVEAEHILRNIKTEGLSPRRLPGPANKRVELLRSAECPKTARVADVPSTNITSLRFSPRPGGIPPNVPVKLRSPLLLRKQSTERQNHHRSPKHKRKTSRVKREIITSSSEDERPRFRAPPQSEPVKRKVYATNKYLVMPQNNCNVLPQRHRNSAESLRHQVLINTIANLKKSLEDQSASLKQSYRSPQHCPPCL